MLLTMTTPQMVNVCYINENEKKIIYNTQINSTQSINVDDLLSNSPITQFISESHTVGNNISKDIKICNTIKNITAYDLVDNRLIVDYKINGGVIMNNIRDINQSSNVNRILKYYDISIKFFFGIIGVLLGMFFFNPFNISKLVLAFGVFMFLCGTLGMYIDKVRWKEQNKCF